MEIKKDYLWDDNPVDVTAEANFIWSIANKLRGTYMPDKYGDVIIPMTIIRRFECALEKTKENVLKVYKENPNYPPLKFEKTSGYQFYCTSEFNLKELCNDTDHLVENFISYLNGFSSNVHEIAENLSLFEHIKKMDKGGCLLPVVKAFSELDLDPETYDSIKMGYIFENLIGRFYQNVDAGQYYTGRDIIKLLVSILTAEGCDDILEDHKVITVLDQACGTGGMLSTTYSYLKHINPSADIRLFGQEFMDSTHAIGLAEMLIKGQDAKNFRHADTFKVDCFEGKKMRFVIENPPFGTPWSGKDAKEGQEEAVRKEFDLSLKGETSRWGHGLPSGSDAQLIFMQSAIDKMDDKVGRAAIIENGSPLFAGGTSSGESQIRRWILENDLLEAIVALPTDLFYNTGIQTYVWILSKNKRKERKGKVQLIDASNICHKLRKAIGNKRNEIQLEDRELVTKLYKKFEENELVKIYNNEDFLYKEYSIMQPLQRSYAITEDRINNLLDSGLLSFIYDEAKYLSLKERVDTLTKKETEKYKEFEQGKHIFENIIDTLRKNCNEKLYLNVEEFNQMLIKILPQYNKKIIDKVISGLSKIDKSANIQRDKKGNIIYDKDTKYIELVPYKENIDDFMKSDILQHFPDAKAFFEENLTLKKPIIKIGAEIPFTRFFYKYDYPESSDKIAKEIMEIEEKISEDICTIFNKRTGE